MLAQSIGVQGGLYWFKFNVILGDNLNSHLVFGNLKTMKRYWLLVTGNFVLGIYSLALRIGHWFVDVNLVTPPAAMLWWQSVLESVLKPQAFNVSDNMSALKIHQHDQAMLQTNETQQIFWRQDLNCSHAVLGAFHFVKHFVRRHFQLLLLKVKF